VYAAPDHQRVLAQLVGACPRFASRSTPTESRNCLHTILRGGQQTGAGDHKAPVVTPICPAPVISIAGNQTGPVLFVGSACPFVSFQRWLPASGQAEPAYRSDEKQPLGRHQVSGPTLPDEAATEGRYARALHGAGLVSPTSNGSSASDRPWVQ